MYSANKKVLVSANKKTVKKTNFHHFLVNNP